MSTETAGGRVANKQGHISIVALIAVAVSFTAPVWAENNTITNIIGPTIVSNGDYDYFVGKTGTNNMLSISSGGILTNVGSSYIGYNSGANNNSAIVTDIGSSWSSVSLYVGYNGVGNALVISNGGQVFDEWGYTGGGILSSGINNNAVTVFGSGSTWNNGSTLNIGYNGASNTLTITNGGSVYSHDSYIGYGSLGNGFGASNNVVTVAGFGSIWTNSGVLVVGDGSAGNRLVISSGGVVCDTDGSIGYRAGNSSNAINCMVTVNGVGSVWTNRGILVVGQGGAGNTLTITNGGQVHNTIGLIGDSTAVRFKSLENTADCRCHVHEYWMAVEQEPVKSGFSRRA